MCYNAIPTKMRQSAVPAGQEFLVLGLPAKLLGNAILNSLNVTPNRGRISALTSPGIIFVNQLPRQGMQSIRDALYYRLKEIPHLDRLSAHRRAIHPVPRSCTPPTIRGGSSGAGSRSFGSRKPLANVRNASAP